MDEKEKIKKLKQIERLESMQKENMEKIDKVFKGISLKGRIIYLWFSGLFSKKQKNN